MKQSDSRERLFHLTLFSDILLNVTVKCLDCSLYVAGVCGILFFSLDTDICGKLQKKRNLNWEQVELFHSTGEILWLISVFFQFSLWCESNTLKEDKPPPRFVRFVCYCVLYVLFFPRQIFAVKLFQSFHADIHTGKWMCCISGRHDFSASSEVTNMSAALMLLIFFLLM